jgi:hypothetical protein
VTVRSPFGPTPFDLTANPLTLDYKLLRRLQIVEIKRSKELTGLEINWQRLEVRVGEGPQDLTGGKIFRPNTL